MIDIIRAYPDYLDLYGEYSAVKLLEMRLRGGIQEASVRDLSFGMYADIENADMIYIGAGTENRILTALDDLRGYSRQLSAFLEKGGLLLASGSSMAILCSRIEDRRTGNSYEGLGIFDAEAVITPKRRYGELICDLGEGKKVIGAVNSSIDFVRNEGQEGLFRVIWDSSKRFPKDSWEGMRKGDNVFASEMTGPLICRNPRLLDELAGRLTGGELPECNGAWYREAWKAYEHAYEVLASEAHIKQQ